MDLLPPGTRTGPSCLTERTLVKDQWHRALLGNPLPLAVEKPSLIHVESWITGQSMCVCVCVLEVTVTGRAGRLRDVFKLTELPVQPPAEYLTDTHLLTTHFVLGR